MLLIIYKAASRKLTTTKRTKTKNLEENRFKVYNVKEVEQPALPQSGIILYSICCFSVDQRCFDVPWNIWEILPKLGQTFQNHHRHNIVLQMHKVKQLKLTKQDHLRMNIAPDQTIILGLQIFLDHRSYRTIDQKF